MIAGYKLLSYYAGARDIRAGILLGTQVYDAAHTAGQPSWATMSALLSDWKRARPLLAASARRIARGALRAKARPLATTRLAAPVPVPGAVFCAGANYADHVANMAKAAGRDPEPDPHHLGLKPWHFMKAPRSAVVGPSVSVKLPPYSKKIDWEIELAAVIGTQARGLSIEKALECVAGYTIANDLSARDCGKREHVADNSPFKYDWIGQKCFDGSCPMGPWITPASDIADPQKLGMKLWVGDELMQDSNSSRMIFTLAEQISHLSSCVTLYPGDVILTGTPAGVGAERGRFLRSGETVKLWIEGVGEFSHRVM